jgi:hypothetical protein
MRLSVIDSIPYDLAARRVWPDLVCEFVDRGEMFVVNRT